MEWCCYTTFQINLLQAFFFIKGIFFLILMLDSFLFYLFIFHLKKITLTVQTDSECSGVLGVWPWSFAAHYFFPPFLSHLHVDV